MTSDELPPPAPHARPRRSSHPDRDGGPNYLVRRAAAVAALLAVIGVAAAVTLAVTRDDGDAADDGTGWNGVAVVDTATGAIALLDADGAETGTVAGHRARRRRARARRPRRARRHRPDHRGRRG
jgi:hypothetical protein